MKKQFYLSVVLMFYVVFALSSAYAQIGTRFPSEKKVVKNSVTGIMLTFLTNNPHGDTKFIRLTHNGHQMVKG
jgi:oligogalacturonide lyase